MGPLHRDGAVPTHAKGGRARSKTSMNWRIRGGFSLAVAIVARIIRLWFSLEREDARDSGVGLRQTGTLCPHPRHPLFLTHVRPRVESVMREYSRISSSYATNKSYSLGARLTCRLFVLWMNFHLVDTFSHFLILTYAWNFNNDVNSAFHPDPCGIAPIMITISCLYKTVLNNT